MTTIGKRIKLQRKHVGLTQEALAEKLGYRNKTSITKIENGTNDIPQSKLYAFANALDTSVSYLIGWSEDENASSNSSTNVFSIRFKTLRAEKGLSQQILSDKLKISKNSINMYERGEREPSFTTLISIADFFDVDIDYLLGRQDKKRKIDILINTPDSNHNNVLTKREYGIIAAYRSQTEMQPAVDRLLGITSQPNHSIPIAAHNDKEQNKEEQALMQEDLNEL